MDDADENLFGQAAIPALGGIAGAGRGKRSDAVYRAIADPTRREILNLLRGRQRTVGEIARNFRMSRPAVSKHLRLLRSAGLVVSYRHGTTHICGLNAVPLKTIDEWLREYQTFWTATIESLP